MGVSIGSLLVHRKERHAQLSQILQDRALVAYQSLHLIFLFVISLSILRGFNVATCYKCFPPVCHLFFNLFLLFFSLHPFLLVFGTCAPSFQKVLASLWFFFSSHEERCLTLTSSLKPGSLMDASSVRRVSCVRHTDRRWKFISSTITVFAWRKV